MKLDELYPYWSQAHDELCETVRHLSDAEVDARPRPGAPSIRDIVLGLVYDERFWVSHIVAGNEIERPRADRCPDGRALSEILTATREVSALVLAPLGRDGLRAVRRVPADAGANRPETNAPIGWLFWHVLERELFAWGQVQQRLDDARKGR